MNHSDHRSKGDSREPQVRSTLRKMLVANQDARTEFNPNSQKSGSWIRAARVVADVLHKRFLTTVRAHEAPLDGYLRHGRQSYF